MASLESGDALDEVEQMDALRADAKKGSDW